MSKNISVKKIVSTTKEVSLHIDGVTLLSIEEYEKAKEHIKPVGRAWWLRSPGFYDYYATLVDPFGRLYYTGHNVADDVYAVRPALKINLESSELQVGDSFQLKGYTWTVIAEDYALCDTTICNMPFRDNWKAHDANDYEESDIKSFLEDWYIKQISEQPTGEWVDFSAETPKPVCEDAISRQDAIEALDHINIPTQAQREYAIEIFEDIPQVEPKIYGNEHNCIMTMFGECSYSETGCGSCEVVEKVRNALKGECPPVEPKWPKGEWQSYRVENPDMVDGYVGGYACSECGEPSVVDSPFCAWCGADMRGEK